MFFFFQKEKMFKTTMIYVVVNLIIVVSCLATSAQETNYQSDVTESSFDTTSNSRQFISIVYRQDEDYEFKNSFSTTSSPPITSQVSDSVPKNTIKQIVATSRPHQNDRQDDDSESETIRSSIIMNMTSIRHQIGDSVDHITKFLNDTDGYSNDH